MEKVKRVLFSEEVKVNFQHENEGEAMVSSWRPFHELMA